MSFNSLHFLVSFPVVLVVAWTLRRRTDLRIVFLLVASYYFYMSWHVAYAGLILGSTLLDYFVGRAISSTRTAAGRRALLITSVTGNLGVLFLFKYYNFFLDNVAHTLGAAPAGVASWHHSLLLPVGISFYTFQTLSYTIDVYHGRVEPARSFLRFALFVAFFPQLVAGPIVRAAHFLPQLRCEARFDDRRAEHGMAQLVAGLIKKLCIADVLGTVIVDPVFADPSAQSTLVLAVAMYAYAFQIYYDFSGYSDVAIGAARMLGFDLPLNFDRPYTATSLRDFWRRWHISLSTWLRDYLYIPLGGGRGSMWQTGRNLAIVMVLGGLWHGAAWGFMLWGALHGLFLAAGRVFRRVTGVDPDRKDQPVSARISRVALTFHLAALCFVLFRCERLDLATAYFSKMLSFAASDVTIGWLGWTTLLAAALWEWTPRTWPQRVLDGYLRLPAPLQGGLIAACLLIFTVVGGSTTPFIYFQF